MRRVRALLFGLATLSAPSWAQAPSSASADPTPRAEASASAEHPPAQMGPPTVLQQIANATTELDLESARAQIESIQADTPGVAFERARLALYEGDCEAALAITTSPALATAPEVAALAGLARTCAGAVAGALVVHDVDAGVWVRLQDDADRVLVPFLVDVAVRARRAAARDLGVELPRPLRIDLVRDLFTLSAVTGLPTEAAETTGTIAVARWGRVTMVSPRATPLGFPWEDTLAHEVTHLALSRATRDHAPLWLQEGIAKREERRWRDARPFDDEPSADVVAYDALVSGRSVGVDRIGPSIGMLPSPDAARIAFAEVSSFVEYWLAQSGDAALALLLTDLRGLGHGGADRAMVSVTGKNLETWISEWQEHLLRMPVRSDGAELPVLQGEDPLPTEDVVRLVRLGDVLLGSGDAEAAITPLTQALGATADSPSLRWRLARAHVDAGDEGAAWPLVSRAEDVRTVHGGYFALKSRADRAAGRPSEADRSLELALSVDPYREEAACRGLWTARTNPLPRVFPAPSSSSRDADLSMRPPLPTDAAWRALCEEARRQRRD